MPDAAHDNTPPPRKSAVGGAAAEGGSGFRAGAAAYIAAHILRGQPFADLDLLPEKAIPQSFQVEADAAVDDITVQLSGGRAFIQAKRRLEFGNEADSAFKDTVQQWVTLVREQGIEAERERLVATAASASESVKALGLALRRRRRSVESSYSTDERAALNKLIALLADETDDTRERILSSATIWIADLEELDGLTARLGQTLLEPGVVATDQGLTAWKTLREEARDLARRRYGADLDELQRVLRSVPLKLTADSEGYASARYRERQIKLDGYRQRIRARGESLDLRGLGAALPPIPLSEMDARVSVYELRPPSEEDEHDRNNRVGELPWALRRRGRALLLGLPGSGKSVALRATAAFYAARPCWPLPIFVPLDRVARLLETRGFQEAMLEAAFLDEPVEDKAALRSAAIESLREGRAALFLDALDETRAMQHTIVAGIEQDLRDVDPAVEVLLSTRDTAYAFAHTLGLPELRLLSPDRPTDTAKAILHASAVQRQISEADVGGWVRLRLEWIRERLRADTVLGETPLMIVLLSLLAAEHHPDDLPHGRAAVLVQIVNDVVDRWEAGRRLHGHDARAGSLQGREAVRAAHVGFRSIGRVAFRRGDPTAGEVLEALAKDISSHFGLAPGLAEGVADDVAALWDEAGVFVRSGGSRRVQARIKLFAELAEGLWGRELDETGREEWLDALLVAPEGREPVLLAAGLSPAIADAVAARAASDPADPVKLEFIIAALHQGAGLSSEMHERLIDAVIAVEPRSAELRPRARVLAELRPRPDQEPDVLALFDTAESPRGVILRALAADRWPRADASAEEDLAAVLALDLARQPIVGASFFEALGPDPEYETAVLAAMRRLLAPGRDEIAEHVARRVRAVTTHTSTQLRRALVEAGYQRLLDAVDRQARGSTDYEAMFAESDDGRVRLLELIAGLASAAPELTTIERRELDALISLICTSGFGRTGFGYATRGVLSDGERLATALRAGALLGGLDLAVVAAEAAELQACISSEDDQFGPQGMIHDGGEELWLTAWDLVPNQTALTLELIDPLGSSFEWIGRFALRCLTRVPGDAAEAVAPRLHEAVFEREAHAQFRTALFALFIARDPQLRASFTEDAHPMVRRAAARA